MSKPFAFNHARFEELIAQKTGLRKPGCFEAAGISVTNYYSWRRSTAANKSIITPNVVAACHTLNFSLNEFRSLFILEE